MHEALLPPSTMSFPSLVKHVSEVHTKCLYECLLINVAQCKLQGTRRGLESRALRVSSWWVSVTVALLCPVRPRSTMGDMVLKSPWGFCPPFLSGVPHALFPPTVEWVPKSYHRFSGWLSLDEFISGWTEKFTNSLSQKKCLPVPKWVW
jgi:hypothetical protein